MSEHTSLKSGPKPKGKVAIKWSPDFAYAIGLIATDGNLASQRYLINFTSKDLEQIENFQEALGISVHIGKKSRGAGGEKKYYVIQFTDVDLYMFLQSIGITSAKSKTLGVVSVPEEFFFDFLRGAFDGDGYSHSYFDKRWKSSFLFYLGFCSASFSHIAWLRSMIKKTVGVKGHISMPGNRRCWQLRYAKREAKLVAGQIYKQPDSLCLSRKKLKIEQSLAMMSKPQLEKGVNIDKYARVL